MRPIIQWNLQCEWEDADDYFPLQEAAPFISKAVGELNKDDLLSDKIASTGVIILVSAFIGTPIIGVAGAMCCAKIKAV